MGTKQGDEHWEKELRAAGIALHHLKRHAEGGNGSSPMLTEVRLKLDADEGTSVLMILKATGSEGSLVAFVGGADMVSVILSAAKKIVAGVLRWREDRPWSER